MFKSKIKKKTIIEFLKIKTIIKTKSINNFTEIHLPTRTN